jgi:hypothetical protein
MIEVTVWMLALSSLSGSSGGGGYGQLQHTMYRTKAKCEYAMNQMPAVPRGWWSCSQHTILLVKDNMAVPDDVRASR